jgi:small subunit ribosomal protein S2
MPYVAERWVGGTLTNFPEIKKRVSKLLDLREKKNNGEFEKYTKKEQLLLRNRTPNRKRVKQKPRLPKEFVLQN